ncbi:MAG: DNA-directed RNA polymerase subunit alpha C-terminal domain-containing protein [bacterium]
MTLRAFGFSSSSDASQVLERFSQTSLNAAASVRAEQAAFDGLVSGFVEESTNWRSLAAMMAGGMAYRLGRVGVMSFAGASSAAPILGLASRAAGLASEVTVFEGMGDILRSPSPLAGEGRGEGGFWNRWRSSFVQFGMLKLGGAAANGQNVFIQHLFQDVAMVGGHQLTARLGLTPAPEGSLAQQFLHAEATNLQLGLSMGLAHSIVPGIHAFENSLELAIFHPSSSRPVESSENGEGVGALEAVASLSSSRFAFDSSDRNSLEELVNRPVWMKNTGGEEGSGRVETREDLRSEIDRHLERLILDFQNQRDRRFADFFSLNQKIEKILGRIFSEGPLEAEETERLHRSADQFHRVLRSWGKQVPLASFTEVLSQIELGLTQRSGSILAERAVRDFCREFAPAASSPRVRALRRSDPSTINSAPVENERPPPGWTLRDYQRKMLNALREDVVNETNPWLGVASPMQTGKSFLAGPIIQMLREGLEPNTRFVVLSSARVITDQVVADLLEGFPSREVGRFDGNVKQVRTITVASAFSLARHLEDFTHDGPTVLINDEAFSTQSPTFRRIYQHFGLAEEVKEGSATVLRPKAGRGLVIGLSGTGNGLEGYHTSGQLGLLEAIELGWIRHMRGERVMVETSRVTSEEKQSAEEGRMIWWEANEANAEALAEIYHQNLYGRHHKNLVFVPTIEHARLLEAAFQKRYGSDYAQAVHSDMEDGPFDAALAHWAQLGGALISVRRLSRGFRGTGADAVFHTYQTDSPELFAQRTGRAWGQPEGEILNDLYVLEATWNSRGSFANLARLLGLVDYPPRPLSSRGLRERLDAQNERQKREREIQENIQVGKVDAVFSKIPVLESWRRRFEEVVQAAGGVSALAEQTRLPADLITGFALGALPIRRSHLSPLRQHLGGERTATELWVGSWEGVVDELLAGTQSLQERFSEDLVAWRQRSEATEAKAEGLDALLRRHFDLGLRGEGRPMRGLRQLLFDLRKALPNGPSEAELLGFLNEAGPLVRERLGWMGRTILEVRYFSETPRTLEELEIAINLQLHLQHGLNSSQTSGSSRTKAPTLSKNQVVGFNAFVRNAVMGQVLRRVYAQDPLKIPLDALELPEEALERAQRSGKNTLGDFLSENSSIDNLGVPPHVISEIEPALQALGIRLELPRAHLHFLRPPENMHPDLLAQLNKRIESLNLWEPGLPNPKRGTSFFTSAVLGDPVNEFYSRGIQFIWQLVQCNPEDFSYRTIESRLAKRGLSMGMYFGEGTDTTSSPSSAFPEAALLFDTEIFRQFQNELSRTAGRGIWREKNFSQVVALNENDIFERVKNRTALREIREALAQRGLSLGMDVGWNRPEVREVISARLDEPICLFKDFSGDWNGYEKIQGALLGANLRYIGDLVQLTKAQVADLVSDDYVTTRVHNLGLPLGVRIEGWVPPRERADFLEISSDGRQVRTALLDSSVDVFKKYAFRLRFQRIQYLGELIQQTEETLLVKTSSPALVREVRQVLSANGLTLGMRVESWIRPDERRAEAPEEAWVYPPEIAPLPDIRVAFRESDFNTIFDREIGFEKELSVRAANALHHLDIRYVGELVQQPDSDWEVKNFGRKSLFELKRYLASMGLNLGMNLEGWVPPHRRLLDAEGETESVGSTPEGGGNEDS